MEKYERKCANWLESYIEWSRPRCESPDTFITWSGLYGLAASLRRQVKIPRELMGGWEIAPNLYVIFVAPPGRARKSTTIGFIADDILNEVKALTRAPTTVSQAALVKQLAESPDASVYITSHEFSSFIMKSGVEMYEILTDLFDGKRHIESSTISRGIDFAERPCINLLAATTPRWITENMPESVIGGGFASRVIFIHEERVRRRQLYYQGLDHTRFDALKQDLIDDLNHIANNTEGDFKLTDGDSDDGDNAKSFMEEWYRKNAEVDDADYRLSGYLERRPAHIHKVAMLLHIARSDTMTLEKRDFVEAIALLTGVEKNLMKVFRDIGKNKHAPDMSQIADYIKESTGGITKAALLKQFAASAAPALLQELIVGLVQMDEIHFNERDGKFKYGPKPE